jgi:peptidoglycan/LPS O-acetylase OafA/YrhL
LKYRPEFDGIRGYGVLVVLAFHYGVPIHGGWLVVDLFFVLSGYLITRLLITERNRSGRLNLLRFYRGRVLRLAPAMVIAVAIALPIMIKFPDDPMMGYSPFTILFGVLGYVANWLNTVSPPALGPLSHTWSLSIEEQFYMLWPLALTALYRRGMSSKRKIILCSVAIGVVVVSRAALTLVFPADALWFATTSRADAILIGALLAFVQESEFAPVLARTRPWMGWFAVAVLGVASLISREFSPWIVKGGFTLIALASALLIATAVEGTLLARLLCVRPFRAIGRVSYGLYLYHFPVLYGVRRLDPVPSHGRWVVILGVTALLTLGSWFLIEKPIARMKRKERPEASPKDDVRIVQDAPDLARQPTSDGVI